MNPINLEQLRRIRAKIALDLPLTAFELAYYTLYGDNLTEKNSYDKRVLHATL